MDRQDPDEWQQGKADPVMPPDEKSEVVGEPVDDLSSFGTEAAGDSDSFVDDRAEVDSSHDAADSVQFDDHVEGIASGAPVDSSAMPIPNPFDSGRNVDPTDRNDFALPFVEPSPGYVPDLLLPQFDANEQSASNSDQGTGSLFEPRPPSALGSPTSDGGPPLTRPIVLVSLVDMKKLVDDALRTAATELTARMREIAVQEIDSYNFRRESWIRAARGY